MNRRRLDAESLRDAMLAVSGDCSAVRGGGPGLPLEYPENTGGLGRGTSIPPASAWPGSGRSRSSCARSTCRSSAPAPRRVPAEVRNVFDFTQPGEFAGQRAVTTVPTQALFLMNARFLKQRALELARARQRPVGR